MATDPKQDPLDEEIERVLRENPGLMEDPWWPKLAVEFGLQAGGVVPSPR